MKTDELTPTINISAPQASALIAVGMATPLLLALAYFVAFNYKIEKLTRDYLQQDHHSEILREVHNMVPLH